VRPCRHAAQPQLQGGFFEAIAAVTSLRELNIGNWMPDRDGGDKVPVPFAVKRFIVCGLLSDLLNSTRSIQM